MATLRISLINIPEAYISAQFNVTITGKPGSKQNGTENDDTDEKQSDGFPYFIPQLTSIINLVKEPGNWEYELP